MNKNFKFGWHFTVKDNTLKYGDDRKVVPGIPLEAQGIPDDSGPRCCRAGMHASEHIYQAQSYRSDDDANVSLVLVSGNVTDRNSYGKKQCDKFVGRYRTVLKMWKWKYIVGELFTKEYKKLYGAAPPQGLHRTSVTQKPVWLKIEERLKKEIFK